MTVTYALFSTLKLVYYPRGVQLGLHNTHVFTIAQMWVLNASVYTYAIPINTSILIAYLVSWCKPQFESWFHFHSSLRRAHKRPQTAPATGSTLDPRRALTPGDGHSFLSLILPPAPLFSSACSLWAERESGGLGVLWGKMSASSGQWVLN